jgi:hypothetical protein
MACNTPTKQLFLCRALAIKAEQDDDVKMISLHDLQDSWHEQAKKFQPTKTDAGAALPPNSSGLLLIKQLLGEHAHWMLPADKWVPGETLRSVR